MKSIIILCGGRSKRMGKDKGSLILKGRPMILHILDTVNDIADEIILVLRDEKQVKEYAEIVKKYNIKVVTDKSKDQGPLIGILTGLLNIESKYAQVLPCDSPFITKEFILKMHEIMKSSGFDAVVPTWEDGHTEPLHSAYNKSSTKIIEELIKSGKRNVKSLIDCLNVRFIKIEEIDDSKMSFQNMNSINDINSLK